MAQFGPEGIGRVNIGVLFDTLLRQSGIYEPGLIKTNEQMSAEASAQMNQQMEQRAQEQLIATGGNAMEARMSQQGQDGQPTS